MVVVAVAAGWVLGLVLGIWTEPAIGVALSLAVTAGVAVVVSPSRGVRLATLVAVGGGLALVRVAMIPDVVPQLPSFVGVETEFTGTVVEEPERRERGYRLRVAVGEVNGQVLDDSETALVWVEPPVALIERRTPPYFRYGDRIRIVGELGEPPTFADFDYRDYLAGQGIFAVSYYPEATLVGEGEGWGLLRVLASVRAALSRSLGRSLPEPQAALAQALLLGDRGGIPQDLRDAFSRTGTSHLLAVSGLHVGLVLALLTWVSVAALGRRRHFYLILPFVAIWLYAALAGFAPPVLRAAIMGSFYLLGLGVGRQRSSIVFLALSAVGLTVWEPVMLISVSFQLSFLAMIGLFQVAPLLEPPLARVVGDATDSRWRRATIGGVAAGVGATLATWPLVAYNFHIVSFVGVFATVLALPAMALVIFTSLLTVLGGFFWEPLGLLVGWGAWPWSSYLVALVGAFDLLPFASVELGRVAPLLVWAYYGAGIALLAGVRGRRLFGLLPAARGRRGGGSRRWGIAIAVLIVANLGVWSWALLPANARLTVRFLDVGQGDSILIQAPNGRRVLIDGGPSGKVLERELGGVLPFWDRSIDLVVLTHPHRDHLAGLIDVVERRPVGSVLVSGSVSETPTFAEWREVVGRRGVPLVTAEAGQRVELGNDIRLEVLHPPARLLRETGTDFNNNSIVLRLTYGEASFLFTGDVESIAEAYLVSQRASLMADVLKVPHQGSATSSTVPFLAAVDPLVAVVTVGEENSFGHPSAEVLARLEGQVGENLFVTARDGTVEVSTDGRRLWVARGR